MERVELLGKLVSGYGAASELIWEDGGRASLVMARPPMIYSMTRIFPWSREA